MSTALLSQRKIAFTGIRAIGTGVGAIATLVGVGYFVIAAIGPDVWWFGGGSGGDGAFVGFPLPLRLINGAAILLWCLTIAAIAFIVSSLAHSVRTEVRFARVVSRTAWALALVLAIGSTAAQIAENLARGSGLIIGSSTNPANPIGTPIGWGIEWTTFAPNLPFLGLLAYIIGTGERLQREIEGLI